MVNRHEAVGTDVNILVAVSPDLQVAPCLVTVYWVNVLKPEGEFAA